MATIIVKPGGPNEDFTGISASPSASRQALAGTTNSREVSRDRIGSMGSEEGPKEYEELRQIFFRILLSGSVLGGLVVFVLMAWALYFQGGFDWNDPSGSVNIHIILMVFFMFYLHGHASVIYRILPDHPKYAVKLMHAGLHFVVCIGIGVGLAAAVQSHILKKAPHFYSLHSWLGIATISLYYLQFLGGFATFLLPMTPMSFRLLVLPFHRFAGQNLFTFASAATVTGIMLKAMGSLGSQYQLLPPPAILLNTAGFLAICFTVAIGSVLTDYRFRRRPRPGPDGELLLNQGGRAAGGSGDTDQSDQAE